MIQASSGFRHSPAGLALTDRRPGVDFERHSGRVKRFTGSPTDSLPGIRFLLLICLCVGLSLPVRAADIAGAGDPDLRAAVTDWLNDDDAGSLPRLAALAREGNVAARLLLARIEYTDRAASEFVQGLDRQSRVALYRSDEGNARFRQSWMRVEAERGNAFAALLRQAGELGIQLDTVRALGAAGEREAAEHVIRKVAVDGTPAERTRLAGMLDHRSELAPYLHGFRFSSQGVTTGETALRFMIAELRDDDWRVVELPQDADTRRATLFVDIGYQAGRQIADYDASGRHYASITDWLLTAPAGRPLAGLCRRSCADDALRDCALAAFGLVGGYYELVRFDSPLEALISQDEFAASSRAVGMLARRIVAARSEAAVPVFSPAELRARSVCLADAVEMRAR